MPLATADPFKTVAKGIANYPSGYQYADATLWQEAPGGRAYVYWRTRVNPQHTGFRAMELTADCLDVRRETDTQLFITANPILRTSVAKSFKSLQSGFIAAMEAAQRDGAEAAGSGGAALAESIANDEELSSLSSVPERSWPLFLRAHHWLRLLDGTLEEAQRFFSDDERLAAAVSASGWHAEKGGLDELPELEEDID